MLVSEHDGTLWVGVPAPTGTGIAVTSDGLRRHRQGEQPQLFAWAEMSRVDLGATVSTWQYPRAASWLMNVLAAVMSIWSPGDPDTVIITVTRRDGTTVTAEATGYYLTGYLRAEVEAVSDLLRLAVGEPAVRPLLDQPAVVLHAVSSAVRRRAPLELREPVQPET